MWLKIGFSNCDSLNFVREANVDKSVLNLDILTRNSFIFGTLCRFKISLVIFSNWSRHIFHAEDLI